MQIIKISIINIIIFLILALLIETASYFSLNITERKKSGWLLEPDLHIPKIHPNDDIANCIRMKTHPVLSHVHDDRGECYILGGRPENGYVIYDDNLKETSQIVITQGGSNTDGFYQHYSNGNTWPYQLNKTFQNENLPLKIINYGTGAYTSALELMQLLTEIRHQSYNIKTIVSLNGANEFDGYGKVWNNVTHNHPHMTAVQNYMYNEQKWLFQNLEPKNLVERFFPASKKLISNIFFGVGRINYDVPKTDQTYLDDTFYRYTSGAENWYKNVTMSHFVSSQIGADYFVFLQPIMGVNLNEDMIDPNTDDGKIYYNLLEIDQDYFSNAYSLYLELRQYCDLLEYCFDLSFHVKPTGNFFADTRHVNELGNEILAEAIFNIITKN